MSKYPIEGLTDKEQRVLSAVSDHCMDDYSSSVEEIETTTKLPEGTIIGVLGSLTKKGLITSELRDGERNKFVDIWIVIEGKTFSFGDESDNLTPAQFKLAERIAGYEFND